MSPTRDIRLVLTSNAIEYLAFRFTQIALPLVVLHELGSAAAAGIVAGLAGLPVVTSPWWARRLRQRLVDGRGLALVAVWQAVAIMVVPAGLALGLLGPVLLGVVGLAIGVSDALGAPGRVALLGDLGDLGDRLPGAVPGAGATRLVTWDDATRRAAMVVGPALAGIGVALGWTTALLWVEGVGLLLSAALIRRVVLVRTGPAPTGAEAAPGILDSVRGHSDVLRGWVMRGTSCLTWFAFALGLVVLGEQTGQPGTLYATALTAYGIGSFVTTVVIARFRSSRRPLRTATIAWVGQGVAFAAMSFWSSPVAVAAWSACAGLATVVGIRAMMQVLLRQTTGPARRAALAGQSILVDVTVSVGMLAGGLLLDHVRAQTILFASGLLTALVAVLAGTWRLRESDTEPAHASEPSGIPPMSGTRRRIPAKAQATDDAAA